jgi:hypothetical protein
MIETRNKKSLIAPPRDFLVPSRNVDFFIRGSKMVRFGTKKLDRQNWLPQHQQLTKNKMVRLYHPYHFGMPPKLQASPTLSNMHFSHPEFWRSQTQNTLERVRTPTNTVEHLRTPSTPKSPRAASISHSHRSKPPPSPSKKTANRCNSVQFGATYRKSPPLVVERGHSCPPKTRSSRPRLVFAHACGQECRRSEMHLCVFYSAHCHDCFYVRRAA